DGTATWMGGITYLRDFAVPTITAAAAKAGRPAPRIVAGLPVAVTTDVAAAREACNRAFSIYPSLPSYRATLERGGASMPGDVALLGTEQEIEAQVNALAAAGVTDLDASIFRAPGGAREQTYELM